MIINFKLNSELFKKYIIITGASGGLGFVLSNYLFKHGYSLWLLTSKLSTKKKIEAHYKSLKSKRKNKVIIDFFDLSNSTKRKLFEKKILKFKYQIYALINNAAIQGPIGPSWTLTENFIEKTIKINLLGPIFLSKLVIPKMIKNKEGVILNLSGGGATAARENFSSYAVSKTGLVRYSEILAAELKNFNIRVNALAPGVMKTKMLDNILLAGQTNSGSNEYKIASELLSKKQFSFQSVIDLIVFLLSKDSEKISGKLISAKWDNWKNFKKHHKQLMKSDILTLRRIVGKDRGIDWSDN